MTLRYPLFDPTSGCGWQATPKRLGPSRVPCNLTSTTQADRILYLIWCLGCAGMEVRQSVTAVSHSPTRTCNAFFQLFMKCPTQPCPWRLSGRACPLACTCIRTQFVFRLNCGGAGPGRRAKSAHTCGLALPQSRQCWPSPGQNHARAPSGVHPHGLASTSSLQIQTVAFTVSMLGKRATNRAVQPAEGLASGGPAANGGYGQQHTSV